MSAQAGTLVINDIIYAETSIRYGTIEEFDAMLATAETVTPQLWPLPAASAEETECILRWLEKPGTRLVSSNAEWSCPVHGAGKLRTWLETVESGRESADPFADRRALHPIARPARATA